ncbi:MAG: sugar phosphate isomerase/epimerase family protein, partial [Thermus sp.]
MRLGFSPFNAEMGYEEAFRLAAELGLDLEVPYDLHEVLPLPDPKSLRATGEALGIGFTLHLPFVEMNPASLIPSVRALAEERLRRALEFGEALGARVGVLHTGQVPVRHPMALSLAREALEKTLSALLPLPFPVALENLALSQEDLLRGPEELKALLDRFPQYGFCLDVGHALVELGP